MRNSVELAKKIKEKFKCFLPQNMPPLLVKTPILDSLIIAISETIIEEMEELKKEINKRK